MTDAEVLAAYAGEVPNPNDITASERCHDGAQRELLEVVAANFAAFQSLKSGTVMVEDLSTGKITPF